MGDGLFGLTGLFRFRPNIVMKGAGAWAEDAWEEIRIGSETAPKISLVSPCARCLVCFSFLLLPSLLPSQFVHVYRNVDFLLV